jgi:hypothetical protein
VQCELGICITRYTSFYNTNCIPLRSSLYCIHRSDSFPTSINIQARFAHARPSALLPATNGYHNRVISRTIGYLINPFFNKRTIVTLDPLFTSSSGPHPASHNLPDCTFLNFNLDCFLTGDNFQRLRKMLIQARWDEMRQKMQVVKNAYISRHYTQCAKYGERLLVEVQGEVSATFTTIWCT